MEQRFKTSEQDIDLLPLREFIEREGEAVAYRRGDQLERERLRVGAQAGNGRPDALVRLRHRNNKRHY